jgi:protein SCO1/2
MVFWLIAPSAAQAGGYRPTVSEIDPEVLKMDESKFLGKKLSGKIVFMDDRGEEFTLGDLRGNPLIMVLSYFTCDGACPAFNAELIELLNGVRSWAG